MPDTDIPLSPPLPSECPISELLGKRIVNMSDEELEAFQKTMRTIVESPHNFKKAVLLQGGTDSVKKKSKAPTAKLDISKLMKM